MRGYNTHFFKNDIFLKSVGNKKYSCAQVSPQILKITKTFTLQKFSQVSKTDELQCVLC